MLADPRLLREAAYIEGAWVAAESGAAVPVRDPASGEMIGQVPAMGGAEAAAAIAAAQRAFPLWRRRLRRSARRSCGAGSSSSGQPARTSPSL